MSLRDFRFVILAEDRHQQEFVYQWLLLRGAEIRKITRVALPAGKGAGEQHVREKLPRELQEHRRMARQNRALFVVVDADMKAVAERLSQLDIQPPRGAHERIVVLVPKRNIETWFHYLAGNALEDEATDHKPTYANMDRPWAAAAKALEAWLTAPHNPPAGPPSLVAARPEFARLPGV